MVPRELIKVAVVGRMMFGTIPPIPVTAFGNQKLFISKPLVLLTGRPVLTNVEVASLGKVIPGEVIFRGSDPNVEVGVDPRARHQRCQRSGIRGSRDRL